MQVIIANVNVNGIRAAERKGFGQWLAQAQPDVLLMQEVRAPESVAREIVGSDYCTWIHPSVIAGRAGVAVAVKAGIQVEQVRSGLSVGQDGWLEELPDGGASDGDSSGEGALSSLDAAQSVLAEPETVQTPLYMRVAQEEVPVDSGRWLEVDLPDALGQGHGVTLISAYLHSGVASSAEKMSAKYTHLQRVSERLKELSQPHQRPLEHVLMAGDFNIVHTQEDITNWKGNHNKTAGVLDDEIAYLDRWFGELGFVDVQRALTGDAQVAYTWWSNRGKAFDNNVGWRIDYQIVDPALAQLARTQRVDRAQSYEQRWSDHAPLVVTYGL